MTNLADLFGKIWLDLVKRGKNVWDRDDQKAANAVKELKREAEAFTQPESIAKLCDWAGDDILKLVAAAQAIDTWYEPLGQDGEPAVALDDARTLAKQFFISNHRLNENEDLGQV